MKINNQSFVLYLALSFVLALSSSCEEKTPGKGEQPAIDTVGVSSTGTMKFEGELISVPSPIQVATLISKNKIPFKQELLSSLQNKSKYLNETKKALNLGVYGADMAYIANYNLGQINNDYFDVLASLSTDLGILDNIDSKLISKLNSNMNNRDSLLALNASFFSAADLYLKSGERSHLSRYILIGGWVESLHLTAQMAATNAEFQARLSEQKYSASSILSLIEKSEDPAFSAVKDEIKKLCNILSELESTYLYRQPINDQREKITYIRSQTSVSVSAEDLKEIIEQVAVVRNAVIE